MYKLHVFSVGVKWIDINNHVKRYGKAVLTVPADGMCFLTSVQMCMKQDLSIEYSLDQIKEKILNEVIDNLDFYQNYHTGNKLKLVQDTLAYINLNKFTLDVVDVVVNACANSLDINMYIFSRNGDDALLLPTLSHNHVPKNQCIFLKYDRFGGDIHVGDHYSPIVQQPFPCTSTSTNVTKSTNTIISNSNTTTTNTTTTSTTTTTTTDTNQSSTNVTNTCDTQRTISMTQHDVTLTSSQQLDTTLDTTIAVPSNDIMDEILEACGEEDKEEEYFDLFGSPIDVTQTEATIDVGHNNQSGENVFQDLIDLTNVDPKSSTILDPMSSTNLDPKSHNLQETSVPTNENSDVEVVSSDNSERDIPQHFQREDRPKQRKYAKSARFNCTKFLQMEKEYVNRVPWDVDDTHYYVISTNKDEWIDCSKDGRWYTMHTSSRKGFKGIRKTGTCRGSLMCENTKCSKLLTEGVCNTNEFSIDLGAYVCKCCGYYGVRANCGAKKMTEFDPETNKLVIWYEGKHNCKPKPDIKKKEQFLKTLPVNDERIQKTHQQVQMDLLKVLISEGNINKAVGLTRQMDDASLIEKMRYMAKKKSGIDTGHREDNIEAFRNVLELKKATDVRDTNLIYALNCKELSQGPSYVFKTSTYALQTAVKMDPTKKTVRGQRSLLSYEPAYYDGMHRRCRGFKTLTLWTHHPGMRRMRRLATMEVERETQEMVALFFKLFNEALAKYVGDPNYKFNPSIVMCDEAGANIQGLKEVFGPDFVNRIATCQWHFYQCAWRQLRHIDEGDRKTFIEMVYKICQAMTVHEYKLASRCWKKFVVATNV